MTREAIHAALQACVGCDFEYEIDDVSRWIRKMVVADRFSDGRIFLAGDAAHAHPPNGGLGMNTGIQDGFDLGWKLAAMLDGWGGRNLLASYDIERRPASARAAQESLRNYGRLTDNTGHPGLLDSTRAGDELRRKLGERLVEENEKAWHAIGVHLGYSYLPSPIVIDDSASSRCDDPGTYVPSACPGNRAPHFWLRDGKSVLDLFGDGFALLSFAEFDPGPAIEAAKRIRLPLSVYRIDDTDAAVLYERKLVLIRPDGHVAWRGDDLPDDISELFDTVRGAGSVVSACRARLSEPLSAS
ncbi:Monooxygenase, FAD-binding protein (fragment) [Paraburkholderia piptadeniae]|uniref:Monooxygenase, FAD-binding protein n=1 Tax=Paraburkholderia piptadeniae TaxID=1701573 RepID=A0A1N7SIW4_9BURK